MTLAIRSLALALTLVGVITGAISAQGVDEVLQALRAGGHVIVFRHGPRTATKRTRIR